MTFRLNPEPLLEYNSSRARTRGPSASTEVAVLALAATAGAVVGGLTGRTGKSAGIGAGIALGAAIALIVTAEEG